MKLLLIRHGDPDYEHDSLTPSGFLEAEYLAERIAPLPVKEYYVSTMGRARATAAPTLARAGRSAVPCDWLREFEVTVQRPDKPEPHRIPWDWLPQDWLADPRFLDREHWMDNPVFRDSMMRETYGGVVDAFDRVLSEHGYVRDGLLYRAERPNHDTLVFFCHLGVSCVLLSHLLNCSPMVLWHGLAMAPSSVSTVYTEERRSGTALFRAASLGDVSHLYAHGAQPSFAARFCEVHGDGTRED